MAIEIGSKGLVEANLIIPQGASLPFTIVHKDEAGHAVDHTGATVHMAFQTKDGKTSYDMSPYCTGVSTGISVLLPANVTKELPKGKFLWDMFSELPNGGDTFRIAYGTVTVEDTYALDGD